MPRPKRHRQLQSPPTIGGLRPFGGKEKPKEQIHLLLEEYEAIRLSDYQNFPQQEAAQMMEISRPTFTRIYDKARKKMAESLIENKTLLIQGGDVNYKEDWFRCNLCETTFRNISQGESTKTCSLCGSQDIHSHQLSF
ncbi:MAG: DUF134 domain-containing protein [Bacteroidales bacterium]|nr:DUF134 domain-containing protein [Bacteroidales bacterium]